MENIKPTVADCSFRELIESGRPYADKSEILFNLLTKRGSEKSFTLSRPDGFGKTTLLDTLEALFSGQKDLFKGLYIEDKWDFDQTYPILRFNMKALDKDSAEENKKVLLDMLLHYVEEYDLADRLKDLTYSASSLFSNLIWELYRKTGKKVVILVDDFDAPLLRNIQSNEWEATCRLIYTFLSRTKPRGEHIRFFFMTGLTRFIANEFCEDFNSVIVLSDDPEYVDLCGFTDEDVDRYFTPYFEKHFEEAGITSDEEKVDFKEQVREYYGGYRFSFRSDTTIYNPTSLSRFVNSGCTFAGYWTAKDPGSLAEKLVRPYTDIYENEIYCSLTDKSLTVIDLQELLDSWLFLYMISSYLRQVGYLTIDKEIQYGYVRLRYPNREAEDLMVKIIRGGTKTE